MSVGFVKLSDLLPKMPEDQQKFLSKVIARDQNLDKVTKTWDGTDKGIVRQMQNDICQKCHEDYKRKFPGKPFSIKCIGINDEQRFIEKQMQMQGLDEEMSIEEIRDIYDPAFWVGKNIVVKDAAGDYIPMPVRWYQTEALNCTAMKKIDRWARGLGKTQTGIGEELHMALTRKKLEIIIVVPQQTQAEMWYNGILEQIENSAPLAGVLAQQKQSPFYLLRFHNGSIIKIFTAGSSSGKKGGAVRGQNPRRIRLDEQDYLAEGDYDAIMPLIRRFKELTFHGSSTPTGLRGMYYKMCRVFPDYKEFFHPITDHPEWDESKREDYILEAKTMDRFIHEFLAEFGDPTAGVFKSKFVDESLMHFRHATCRPEMDKRHVIGIDWNGQGTGTRIYVIQYDPITRKRRAVDRAVIDDPSATVAMSIKEIKRLNRKWMADHIYIDAGFGFAQDELIRGEGQLAKGEGDNQTAKLKNIKKIDFGGSLLFNMLVPNREIGQKKIKGEKDEELKRPTKPFMVEGAVMAFEQGLVEIDADDDKLLEEQIRGYRVKNWSAHGTPSSYETDAESGDHDLDAFMLAMLGVEIEYGLFQTKEAVRRLAQISYVAGWGAGSSQPLPMRGPENPLLAPVVPTVQTPEERRESAIQKAGASRGTMRPGRTLVNGQSGGGMGANTQTRGNMRTPSRTSSLVGGRGNFGTPASPFNTIGNGIQFNSGGFSRARFGR